MLGLYLYTKICKTIVVGTIVPYCAKEKDPLYDSR